MKSFSIKVNKKITDFNKTTYINGCKSSTIRFFFIASLAYGVSSARGILESEDVLTTIKILKKQLGVRILKKKDIYYVYSNGLNSYKTRNNLKDLKEGHRRIIEGHFKIIYKIEKETVYITDFFDSRQSPEKMKG